MASGVVRCSAAPCALLVALALDEVAAVAAPDARQVAVRDEAESDAGAAEPDARPAAVAQDGAAAAPVSFAFPCPAGSPPAPAQRHAADQPTL